MSDVLKKVHNLIALSASDNSGEARNAAYAACKLIREYGLLVVPDPTTLKPQRPKQVTIEDLHNFDSTNLESVYDFFINCAGKGWGTTRG